MRRPQAVIFDLDGTLIDSRGDIAAACNFALERAGRARLSVEAISAMVGDGARVLVARAFALPPDSKELDSPVRDFNVYYTENSAKFATYLPGAQEAMQTLRDRGLKIALATNKPRPVTVAVMAAMDMAKYFHAVAAGGDGPLKPAADPLLRVLAELTVAPTDAWMVGDGPQDVGAGKAAGCTTIAVGGGFAAREHVEAVGADRFLESLAELVPLIVSLANS